MISKDLLRKIRQLEIKTRKNVTELMIGSYHSAFRGQGIVFSDVKEYTFGDDVKKIDWNVSTRSNGIFIKRYEEERELSVLMIIDISGSQDFGSGNTTKRELAMEIAAIITHSAMKNRDKVSLLLFSDKVDYYLPAKKSREHSLLLLREIATERGSQKGTNIKIPLDYLNKVIRKKGIVFLISDFLTDVDFEKALTIAGKRHDMIAIQIGDPLENSFPSLDLGPHWVEDAESSTQMLVDFGNLDFIENYYKEKKLHLNWLEKIFRKTHTDLLSINTDDSAIHKLTNFFAKRHNHIHGK